ncbi:hypothetical protein [Priestia megaterium]|uniref:hypothetical protein n=1 Tax=Priestia megaterium TaxID=1404 RepID=UPI00047299F1|nr:hypothetical protein [Priestia megaterium]
MGNENEINFIFNANRSAWGSIRGIVYQACITVKEWLLLKEGEVLEVERGEDISRITHSHERVLIQVKHDQDNITLTSDNAFEAIVNFYGHILTNPNMSLHFVFSTNAQAGKERGVTTHIETWEKLRKGKVPYGEIFGEVQKIKKFLKEQTDKKDKPGSIPEDVWKKWKSYISSSSSDKKLYALIMHMEWQMNNGAIIDVERDILALLQTRGVSLNEDQQIVYQWLFNEVITRLSTKDADRLSIDNLKNELKKIPTAESTLKSLDQKTKELLESWNNDFQTHLTSQKKGDDTGEAIQTLLDTLEFIMDDCPGSILDSLRIDQKEAVKLGGEFYAFYQKKREALEPLFEKTKGVVIKGKEDLLKRELEELKQKVDEEQEKLAATYSPNSKLEEDHTDV